MTDDDRLKLGKPQGDPVRLDFPDPVPGSDDDEPRPNAARLHRRAHLEQVLEEHKELHFPDPQVVEENES